MRRIIFLESVIFRLQISSGANRYVKPLLKSQNNSVVRIRDDFDSQRNHIRRGVIS